MATVEHITNKIRVVSLKRTDLAQLEALFDEQCTEWLELLGWDYTGPSRLIREVARARELSGFSIASGNATVGFGYYTIEAGRCSIGDVYISRRWRGQGLDRQLVATLLDEIDRDRAVRRIESQCVSIDNDACHPIYGQRGFTSFERRYMSRNLPIDPGQAGTVELKEAGIVFRSWSDQDFSQAARVIYRSYRGEHDSLINSQYQTEEGCADLLSILTDHLWCGEFLPNVSRVAVSTNGRIAGVLIATRLAPYIVHFAQISVHPSHQNKGVGRGLVISALEEAGRIGYDRASLAVTASNAPAYHLYESCGFRTIHSFPVYFRETAR
jgi:ribosomal protein S18 acetylase RimI-like enzyme